MERDMAEAMLENVSSDVHKYYFDPKLDGLDWDALVRETKRNIEEAPSMAAANAQIEGLLERLNDSHTHFLPPGISRLSLMAGSSKSLVSAHM